MEENKFAIEEITSKEEGAELDGAFAIEEVESGATSVEAVDFKEEENDKSSHLNNLKATSVKKPFTKEYVSGGVFIALAVATLIVGFVVEGYTVVGIICCLLGSFAAYAMLSHVYECKKIQKLLDDGRCSTITELMALMKKRKKYEFMRTLGGMIRDGHLVGYEIKEGEKIEKVN